MAVSGMSVPTKYVGLPKHDNQLDQWLTAKADLSGWETRDIEGRLKPTEPSKVQYRTEGGWAEVLDLGQPEMWEIVVGASAVDNGTPWHKAAELVVPVKARQHYLIICNEHTQCNQTGSTMSSLVKVNNVNQDTSFVMKPASNKYLRMEFVETWVAPSTGNLTISIWWGADSANMAMHLKSGFIQVIEVR